MRLRHTSVPGDVPFPPWPSPHGYVRPSPGALLLGPAELREMMTTRPSVDGRQGTVMAKVNPGAADAQGDDLAAALTTTFCE